VFIFIFQNRFNMYKLYPWLSLALVYSSISLAQNVGIGTTTPVASAKLDVSSTTSGFLAPRMTTTQRDAIANPAVGLMIVNSSTNSVEFFDGTSWLSLANAVLNAGKIRLFMGGNSGDNCNDIQPTTDGGYIMCGSTIANGSGTIATLPSFGAQDFIVIKMDIGGHVVWQKLYGGSNTDVCRSIRQTSDGGFILTGFTTSSNSGTLTGINLIGGFDTWVIKLNANGNVAWQKLFGGVDIEETAVISQTADGGYIVGASSTSSNTGTLTGLTNNGGYDYLLIKLDALGNVSWQKLLGGSANDKLTDVRQTTDGGYIVSGYSVSSNTGTLAGINNNGNEDYWIIKLDASGNLSWQKLLGGTGFEVTSSIVQTTDGGYIVAGHSNSSNTGTLTGLNSNGSNDFWIVKMDGTGAVQWQKLLGGSSDEFATSISQTTDGGYIAGGSSFSSNTGTLTGFVNAGTQDIWVIKIDISGTLQWQRLIGGTLGEGLIAVRQTSEGGYILGGSVNSSNTGAFSGLFNNGNSDILVLKLDKNGN
jgi:hypothetical protein